MAVRRWFSTGATAPLPRSVYLARIHRAFLLRVHPDRFRSQPWEVRQQQAELVSAIGNRLASADILAYTCGNDDRGEWATINIDRKTYHYVLEHKDGSLLKLSMKLHNSVEDVLRNISRALEAAGTTSLPTPPPPRKKAKASNPSSKMSGGNGIHWASSFGQSNPRGGVDHRYDINSSKGRDLFRFLKCIDNDLVEERRAHRIDVTAVALVARRAFSFSSVDGTGLGWSSASLAILLRSLVALHEEHQSKFRVQSFYPLRLVLSSEEFEYPLDLFGGILYLNPASTPIQWLDHLLLVTDHTLQEVRSKQKQLQENLERLQRSYGGVKFQKGYSCSNEDYHVFLHRLADNHQPTPDGGLAQSSTALTLGRVVVTVESPQACRRSIVTKDGIVRVSAAMDGQQVAAAVSKWSQEASERVLQEENFRDRCRRTIEQAQWELGLQKVYRTKLVRTDQVLECLVRLLAMGQKDQLRRNLAGNSLGIAGGGQHCHLGDDGSVVIPWDWI